MHAGACGVRTDNSSPGHVGKEPAPEDPKVAVSTRRRGGASGADRHHRWRSTAAVSTSKPTSKAGTAGHREVAFAIVWHAYIGSPTNQSLSGPFPAPPAAYSTLR